MRNIDHAVAEFEPDGYTVHTLTGRMRVERMPFDRAENCELLVPVHAYEQRNHNEAKLAMYAGVAHEHDNAFRVQGSYGANTSKEIYDLPVTFRFRVEITNAHVGNIWLYHDDAGWARVAHTPNTEHTRIRELDTMTEIQSDGGYTTDLSWGQIQSRWTDVYTEEAGWVAPREALRWSGIEGPRGDHDGEVARIDWMQAMESGAFVFDHYVQ